MIEETFIYNGKNNIPRDAINVTVASNVTEIGEKAFHQYTCLSNITIPPSVTTIGILAFAGCTSLITLTLPPSIKSIGTNAFDYCSSLINITLPPSITTIAGDVFSNCTSLSSILLPKSLSSIEYFSFWQSSITSITLPPSLKTIGSHAFFQCFSLKSIVLPPSITSIRQFAFANCSSLHSVKLQSSIITIECGAFTNCPCLTSIEIPPSLLCLSISDRCECVTDETVINNKLDTLYDVIDKIEFLTRITLPLFETLGLENKNCFNDAYEGCYYYVQVPYINREVYSKIRNKNGRWNLFIAIENGLKWSDGLEEILEGNGAAIEETDIETELEAFMLAAVEGSNSNVETVYKLLQDHPGAIIPYV